MSVRHTGNDHLSIRSIDMKKSKKWSLALALALLLLAGGCGQEEVQEEESDESAVAVEIQRVERSSIAAESTVSGQVAAGDQESVFLALSAQFKDVYVEVGDNVTAGQTLFTVDISSTLDNIQTTKMSMASARKNYQDQSSLLSQQIQQARDQLEKTKPQLELANSQLDQANAQLAMAEKNLADTQALLAIGAASQLEVDNAGMAVDNAKMGVQNAEIAVDSVKSGMDSAQLSINNLVASQNSAREQYTLSEQNSQSTLNQLEASLKGVDSKGNVAAPISGTVISLNAFKNGFSAPGSPMATIESTSDREITASLSESLVPKIHTGDRVNVKIESANAEFQGTISDMESSANPATHLYGVTISIPAGQGAGLLAGMFAEITFFTDSQSNVVVIPTEAIQTGVDGSYVYVLDSDNIAHRVSVETGLVGDGVTEVTSGLAEGDALVTVGQFYLSEGTQARVVPHQQGD